MNKFVHTHLHTQYSLRDAITDPEALMKRCSDHGMDSVAVTDHGTLMGIWECAKYAKKYGVKLIPGSEVYIVEDTVSCRGGEWSKKSASAHLVLLAYNQEGWRNLLKLADKSNSPDGFYCQPRIDYKMLREHNAGLFAHTACLGGVTAKAWFKKQPVNLVIDRLREIFQDRFSLEIQLNNQDIQLEYNDVLIKASKETGVPLIATVDSHYLEKSDSHKQDLIFALGLNAQLSDPNRHRYPPEAHSVETPDEVHAKFVGKYGAIGQAAIDRTLLIGENTQVDINLDSKTYNFPSIAIEEVSDYQEYIEWKKGLLNGRR